MFCHKCGCMANDAAAFCEKCGTKLINDENSITNSDETTNIESDTTHQFEKSNVQQNQNVSDVNLDIYNKLKANYRSYPKIIDVILKECVGTGITPVVKGRFFNYHCIYSPIKQDIIFSSFPTWLYYIIAFLCVFLDGIFLTFFFDEKYYLPLSIFLILECLFWIPLLIWCYKEQREITSHINQSLGSDLNVSKIPSIISGVLNSILIVLGCVAMVFSVGDAIDEISNTIDSSNYEETYNDSFYDSNYDNAVTDSSEAERIIQEWLYEHTIEGGIDSYYTERTNSMGCDCYVFELWMYGEAYTDIYVNKENGELSIDNVEYDYATGNVIYTEMSIDDWYTNVYLTAMNGATYSIDPQLVGRWRSYDGGALEFDENGILLQCDFQYWSTWSLFKPSYAECYTDNGRVFCTSQRYYEYKYDIIPPSDNSEYEFLKLDNTNYYKRVEGTIGSGLVGKWSAGNDGSLGYQFNGDGTGISTLFDDYPITWYNYNNGENNVLNVTLYDTTFFDYKVSGDVLTVFLNDESRIYTKIGN